MSPIPASVAEHIVSYLELLPGVLATPETLGAMLRHLMEEEVLFLGGEPNNKQGVLMRIGFPNPAGHRTLLVEIRTPTFISEDSNDIWHNDCITATDYPLTQDGLLRAIVEAKKMIADIRKRGLCPTCEADDPPRKKLKGPGMPKCCGCSMGDMMGL